MRAHTNGRQDIQQNLLFRLKSRNMMMANHTISTKLGSNQNMFYHVIYCIIINIIIIIIIIIILI